MQLSSSSLEDAEAEAATAGAEDVDGIGEGIGEGIGDGFVDATGADAGTEVGAAG